MTSVTMEGHAPDPAQRVVLENDVLRASVLPAIGGLINEFVHKQSGRDLLYHHPRLQPRPAYYRAPVDDWWAGGVIEGLPTGFACSVAGESLPDFGELWSEVWRVDGSTDNSVTLSCRTRIWPLEMTRTISLDEGESCLRMQHRIANLADAPVPILWGIHPTVPVGPRTMLQAPARVEHLMRETTSDTAVSSDSPYAGGPVSYAELSTPGQRFSYLTDLPDDAWFAVWDDDWQAGLGMSFSAHVFPCLWSWVLDGWRGLRAITFEPWTGWPGRLDEAIRLGRARAIPPGEALATTTRLIAFIPCGPLAGFDAAARPIPRESCGE